MRRKSSYSVLLVLLTAYCGGGEKTVSAPAPPAKNAAPKLPSSAEARHLIETSSDLGELEFTTTAVTLPVKKSAMNAVQLDNAKQLAAAGWLRFSGDDVELTKGKDDARFNVRGNGFIDVVPVAKKKVGAVSAVRPSPDGCEADFTWQWEPTEVGAAFKKGDIAKMFEGERHSRATFIWDGTSWSVLRIR